MCKKFVTMFTSPVVRIFVFWALLGSLATATAASASVAYSPETPLVIEVATSSTFKPKDPNSEMVIGMQEYLDQKTGGAIKFDYKGGYQLVATETEEAAGLRTGTIMATILTLPNLEANIPELSVLSLPYLFDNNEQISDFVLNAPIFTDLMKLIEPKFNCVVVGNTIKGMRQIINNKKPLKTVEDFDGLKIRIMDSPLYMELFQTLGANPTPMNYPDALLGMQQGTVDGLDNAITSLYTAGTYKLGKYVSMTNHSHTMDVFLIRKDVFETLSPEHQQFVRDAGVYAMKRQHQILFDFDKECLVAMKNSTDAHVDINEDVDIEALRNKVKPMWERWREKIGPNYYDAVLKYRGLSD